MSSSRGERLVGEQCLRVAGAQDDELAARKRDDLLEQVHCCRARPVAWTGASISNHTRAPPSFSTPHRSAIRARMFSPQPEARSSTSARGSGRKPVPRSRTSTRTRPSVASMTSVIASASSAGRGARRS
jgi:hypothetical protein